MKKEKSEKTFQASYGTEIALAYYCWGTKEERNFGTINDYIARSIDEVEVECRYIHETKKNNKPFSS